MATLTLAPMSVPARTRTVLTRRGRRVLGGTVVAVVFALAYVVSGMVGGLIHGSTAPIHSTPTVQVVVQPGQTLWQLARQVDPTADPRALVDQIAELNGLSDGVALLAGQTLLLPTAG